MITKQEMRDEIENLKYELEQAREIAVKKAERIDELNEVIRLNQVGVGQLKEQLEIAKNSVQVETVEVVKMPKIKLIDNCCRDVTFDYDDGILTIEVE